MKAFANNIYLEISKSAINRLGKRSSAGRSSVSSPARRYIQLRGRILVNTSEREIKRRNMKLTTLLSKGRHNIRGLFTKIGIVQSLQIYLLIVQFYANKLLIASLSHMKHHKKFTNKRVITTITEVLECKERRMVCCSQYRMFLV